VKLLYRCTKHKDIPSCLRDPQGHLWSLFSHGYLGTDRRINNLYKEKDNTV